MTLLKLLFQTGAFSPAQIDHLIVAQNQAAALCGLFGFLVCLLVKLRQRTEFSLALLGPLIQVTLAAGGIVKALFLFFCGFHPEIVPKLSDLPVSLGVASLCAVFLGVSTCVTVFSKPKSPSATSSSQK